MSAAPHAEVGTDTPDEQTKPLATLRALLAIRGHQVHVLASGGFLVCWMGHSRHCGDLVSLEAFVRQVGAVPQSEHTSVICTQVEAERRVE